MQVDCTSVSLHLTSSRKKRKFFVLCFSSHCAVATCTGVRLGLKKTFKNKKKRTSQSYDRASVSVSVLALSWDTFRDAVDWAQISQQCNVCDKWSGSTMVFLWGENQLSTPLVIRLIPTTLKADDKSARFLPDLESKINVVSLKR